MKDCINHTNITGKGITGGVISEITGSVLHHEGDLTISGCKNKGNIISEDQYSAGVVTYLLIMGNEVDFRMTIDSCTNEGAVQSTKYAGGILAFSNVGFNAELSADSMNISDTTKITLNKCSNIGNVTTKANNSMAGGIVGALGLCYISTEISD